MPIINLDVGNRISRHLSAITLISYMFFPDDQDLRNGAELTFRTILAEWYSCTFAKQPKKEQIKLWRDIRPKLRGKLPKAGSDPATWVRSMLFDNFLGSTGGAHEGAVALTDSPSAKELESAMTKRRWSVVYTGKIMALIGSIDQHHREHGASVNKAIHILCRTDGDDKELMSAFKELGFPGVYESSLKGAWSKFKPVAHLCAAYVTTETNYYEDELSRNFREYWEQPPALYDDDVFNSFLLVAKSVENFATSFVPRGRRTPLIQKHEIYGMSDELFEPGISYPPFRELTEQELIALNTYRAPKTY